MEPHQPTTPFGRRTLTLAHVATQMAASNRPPDEVVHKWQVFRAICTGRPKLGVSERALAVLNTLLSFYPETTLTGEDELIVFPSNEQLCLRTHGMPPSTLRRQLASLVDAGLVVRRDSPNGKRYARKGGRSPLPSALTSRRSPPGRRSSSAWRRRSKRRRGRSNLPRRGSRSAVATSRK
jgi:replication initiation protein RepC